MPESEVPIMCTLSPLSMARRLTEFASLFAAGLTGVEREPSRLRLLFAADAERESVIRDLFAREEQCCAFLSFAYQRTGTGLVVEVTAPEEAGPTLDGMQRLAERNAPPEPAVQGRTP
ncbi:hypothetical protein [Spirillospora albida]|uniref:hypothetical protein n=1 Tax=Spirillospora albida TaxID=58123 RepID=UPI000690CFE7|nr:hypothetical protein [Spirillospora albida]